tara:strand:+ start:402 stop:860 length:459 start_codon:yes stop_codon:yes gene_type:complete
MIIKYAKSKPNKETFQIPPIKKLMRKYVGLAYLDVFPYPFDMDALAMLKTFENNSIQHLVLDPPYSERQLKESYKVKGGFSIQGKPKYWADIKNEVMRVCKVGGIVITMGWNSVGMGASRNFQKKEILLVCHGAQHNDTIVTVERKGPVLTV